jgi:aryl-alcohol dehydrogenase-like predicted oxidoreductase
MPDAPERRRLGGTPFAIAPLMLGTNAFGWTADEATSFALLDRFVTAGFNAIDTADVYFKFAPGNKGGESETIIGNWIAQGGGRRDSIMLATKFGMEMDPGESGLSRDYMMRAVEASLRRLRTDRIDLYQSHKPDESVTSEETLRGYEELIASGKVRAIGASNFSPAQLEDALDTSAAKGLPRYETFQPWYNLYDRKDYEEGAERICEARGLGVITFFGLASGFLTGKYRSEADLEGRPRGYRVKNYVNPRGFRILAAIDAVCAELGATPAQVALAWVMARPSVTAPIASATSIAQLDEIMAAARLTLGPEQMARLDKASAADDGASTIGEGPPSGISRA